MIVLWGSNARERPPDLLPPRAQGRQQRRQAVRRRPAPHRAPPSGPTAGSASTSAPTSRSPTPIAREIIHAGLATPGLHRPRHERLRGVRGRRSRSGRWSAASRSPACRPRRSASWPTPTPRAKAAQLCWTLGITEHHNGVDNVLALINLALLTGHVGRYGAGLSPLRGQNNVQGGGDMGALPEQAARASRTSSTTSRARSSRRVGRHDPGRARAGTSREMFEAMERGELRALFVIGENPAQSEADSAHAVHLLETPRPHGRAGHLPHQDRRARRRRAARLRRRGARPRARSPTASGACSACARRSIRRARPATTSASCSTSPPGSATTGTTTRTRTSGTSCAACRRCTPACPTKRLEELGGIQWPCFSRGPARAVVPARPAVGRRPRRSRAARRRSAW